MSDQSWFNLDLIVALWHKKITCEHDLYEVPARMLKTVQIISVAKKNS